ncbi:MAG: ATP synthase F0 subunit B [Desulfovibrionaceae bacterium]|nr:ATP synthase F0 subunit B [Desulfovibrionaceae bacterium]MDD4951374.1 ATP synthase F0 subunit B [Desulfovibrionaceae bacterium]
MIDLDFTIFVQFVNFIITLLVLNILLIKPIREIIKKRSELMSEQLGKVERFLEQADTKLADYQAALGDARKEGVELRNQMKEEGQAEEQTILSSAGDEAASKLKAARAEISVQADAAMKQLSGRVGEYAQTATKKILGQA